MCRNSSSMPRAAIVRRGGAGSAARRTVAVTLVLSLPPSVRLFVATQPVDGRNLNTQQLRRKRPRSEVLRGLERQLVLPLDGLAVTSPPPTPEVSNSEPKKSRKGRHPGRTAPPADLPRVPVFNGVPPEPRVCPPVRHHHDDDRSLELPRAQRDPCPRRRRGATRQMERPVGDVDAVAGDVNPAPRPTLPGLRRRARSSNSLHRSPPPLSPRHSGALPGRGLGQGRSQGSG